jgi:perosamine synthetase
MRTPFEVTPLSHEIVRRLLSIFEPPVALHEPLFEGNEARYVAECVSNGWVSSVGEFVERFERELAALCGVEHAVAVVNGTAALHLALLVAGVERDDEVLVPALSFVATANAVAHCGAVPHFVDLSEKTLGLDPEKLRDHLKEVLEVRPDGRSWNTRTGRRVSVCVPMHTFGHPVEMEGLLQVCGEWGITVVEDAAEGIGSRYKGKHLGSFGRLGAISFNGNKLMTTGGGGVILSDDAEMARRAKHLSTTAKLPHAFEYVHDEVGFNYRLPNINAALGCGQLEQLPQMLERKRALARRYSRLFEDLEGVKVFQEPAGATSNYWLNTLILAPECQDELDGILEATNAAGVMTRPVWRMLPSLPMYRRAPRASLDSAASLERRILNLPSSPSLHRHGPADAG